MKRTQAGRPLPGSEAKIALMRSRAEKGEELHQDGDLEVLDQSGVIEEFRDTRHEYRPWLMVDGRRVHLRRFSNRHAAYRHRSIVERIMAKGIGVKAAIEEAVKIQKKDPQPRNWFDLLQVVVGCKSPPSSVTKKGTILVRFRRGHWQYSPSVRMRSANGSYQWAYCWVNTEAEAREIGKRVREILAKTTSVRIAIDSGLFNHGKLPTRIIRSIEAIIDRKLKKWESEFIDEYYRLGEQSINRKKVWRWKSRFGSQWSKISRLLERKAASDERHQ